MPLLNITISNFRNLAAVHLDTLSPQFNIFHGNNGSGKTSLLEAIHYLSLGRSFRSPLSERVINHTSEKLSLFAKIIAESGQINALGLERRLDGDFTLRFNGNDVHSIAELAHLLPVQLIDSHCHDLLDGAPAIRRKYLDWCIFYNQPDYFRQWQHFTRALKQRNSALKNHLPHSEIAGWTRELISSALLIDQARREYIHHLTPLIQSMAESFFMTPPLTITYYAGWDDRWDYSRILHMNEQKDRLFGHTQAGPHRADIKVTINDIPAKDILSRGQQKLFVCAMIMARGALVQGRADRQLFYLVDDLPSELDSVSRSNLVAQLSKQNAQVFITAIEKNGLDDCLNSHPVKMFHVEHGQITER